MRHASSRGDFVPFVSVLDVPVPQVEEDGLTLLSGEQEIEVPQSLCLTGSCRGQSLATCHLGRSWWSCLSLLLTGPGCVALDGLMFGEHVVQVLAKMFGEHAVQVLVKMFGEYVGQVVVKMFGELAAVYKDVAETVCFSLQVRQRGVPFGLASRLVVMDFIEKNTRVPISGMFKKSENMGLCSITKFCWLRGTMEYQLILCMMGTTSFCSRSTRFGWIGASFSWLLPKRRRLHMCYEQYSLRNVAQKNVTTRSSYFSVQSGDELNSLETY